MFARPPLRRILPFAALVLPTLFVCACAVRESHATCDWPSEETLPLNLDDSSQRQHLTDDALVAEDRAIRYADLTRGHRSGHFETSGKYARARDECMATMFAGIARSHGVTVTQVRQAVGYRRFSVDLAVLLSLLVFYGLAADSAARWVLRSFPFDRQWLVVAATVMTSVVVSVGGLLLGGLWAGLVEMIRVGNDHLSYRVGRSPWSRHQMELFVGGVLLFWLIALWRYWTMNGRFRSADPPRLDSGARA